MRLPVLLTLGAVLLLDSSPANAFQRIKMDPTPPEQEAAVKAIRGWASNIQKNRDGTVRFVRFSKPRVTDENVAHVAKFEQLDYLAVVSPGVTDAGIAAVAGLKNLDTLFLSHSRLTDAGMLHVAGKPKLERLYLDGTRISNDGLQHVASLPALTTLSLKDTAIGDSGLQHLEKMVTLETLFLEGTSVTDEGLGVLSKLPALKYVSLARTGVNGSGLVHLKSHEKLQTLDLSGSEVTAESLTVLTGTNGTLKQLLLLDTPAGSAALKDFRAKLSKTTIATSPAPGQEKSSLQRFLASRTKRAGTTTKEEATLVAESSQVLAPPDQRLVESNEIPDFQRHIIPLLGRAGCNGRTCHGSFQGKGGFRLSMFGYDFDEDRKALTAGDKPRVNLDDPDQSLILRKPTEQVEHGGGERFTKDSWLYLVLRRWIENGAKGLGKESPRFVRLDVTPKEVVFTKPGETRQIKAVAVWSDGTREDVTCLTRFQTNDDTVADVTEDGLIRCVGPGDTYVISFYDNGIFSTQAILPLSDRTGERYPDVPTPTRIDELVVRKLAKQGIVPSALSEDAEFLRRVSLDITGTLPTADEVRDFLADDDPEKRSKKIDELLGRPAHVEWWTNLICDLSGSNAQFLGSTDMNQPAATQWRQWVRRRLQENAGWDEIVAGMFLATSRNPGQTYEEYAAEQSSYQRRIEGEDFSADGNPMHYYWFRSNNQVPSDRALSFGYMFLGVRLQCAQCHKHPFDQWSKQDFEQFTQFFTRIRHGAAPDAVEVQRQLKTKLGVPVKLDTAALRRQMYMRVSAEGKPIPWNEVYVLPPGDKPQIGRVLGGETIDLNEFGDPREPLMNWLVSPENPYFAKAFVNRVWAKYFNVGIVHPPDDFNQANPPSNKALLNYLADGFVKRGYDIRWLHREITNSRTYQLSWRPNDTNRRDERNFSRAVLRRMPAEFTIDAILQATANDDEAKQLAANVDGRKIATHPTSFNGIEYALRIFGKPSRQQNCDCERQDQPTLLQSLYVRNDNELIGWLEREEGWLAQIAAETGQTLARESSDSVGTRRPKRKPKRNRSSKKQEPVVVDEVYVARVVDEAYLRTVSRLPEQTEREKAARHIQQAENTVEGLRDLLWVLLNTKEFLTNH